MEKYRHRCVDMKEQRETRIRRLTDLVRDGSYSIDEESLADAILRHLGQDIPKEP